MHFSLINDIFKIELYENKILIDSFAKKKSHFVANYQYKIDAVIDWFEIKINSICIYVLITWKRLNLKEIEWNRMRRWPSELVAATSPQTVANIPRRSTKHFKGESSC